MSNKVYDQLERERSMHRTRLMLRRLANILGNWMVPAVLWAFLTYLALWDGAASASQLVTTIILIPPLALAGLALAKPQWLQQNLSGYVGEKLLARLDSMNQSISGQIGMILLVGVGLTFIGLRPLVEVMAWVTLIGFVGQMIPGVQKWLQEEPNLQRPPSEADVAAQEARFRAARGESVVAEVVTESAPVAAAPDLTVVADNSDEAADAAPVVMKNPDLVEAENALAAAQAELDAALQETIPSDETAEAGTERRRKVGALRGKVTRCRTKVADLGGDVNAA